MNLVSSFTRDNIRPNLGNPAILVFGEYDYQNRNHGLVEFPVARLKHFLKKNGKEPSVYHVNYADEWNDEMDNLSRQTNQIRKQTMQNCIYFIAYSVGGLLALKYASFQASLDDIEIPFICCVCTPFKSCRLTMLLDMKNKPWEKSRLYTLMQDVYILRMNYTKVFCITYSHNSLVPRNCAFKLHSVEHPIENDKMTTHSLTVLKESTWSAIELVLKENMILIFSPD